MVSKRAGQTQISEDQAELQNRARTLAVSGGRSFVAMVQATHLRYRHDRPRFLTVGSGVAPASLSPTTGAFWIDDSNRNSKQEFGVGSAHQARSHGRDIPAEWS